MFHHHLALFWDQHGVRVYLTIRLKTKRMVFDGKAVQLCFTYPTLGGVNWLLCPFAVFHLTDAPRCPWLGLARPACKPQIYRAGGAALAAAGDNVRPAAAQHPPPPLLPSPKP